MKFQETLGIEAPAAGVAFLASCLDEILYEYTAATYKPRVMSLRALITEALRIVKQVESGAIDPARISPVLDELAHAVSGDAVAKAMLDFQVDYYTSFTKDASLRDLKVRLGLLKNKYAGGRYEKALQHELIRLCLDDKEKAKIRRAARSWVSSQLSVGFSNQFLAKTVEAHFFSAPIRYSQASDLASFFREFDGQSVTSKVYFCASDIVTGVAGISEMFKSRVLEAADPQATELAAAGLVLESCERIVEIDDVNAKDVFSARKKAEKRLEHVSDLYAVFHHKNKIRWQATAVVKCPDGLLHLARASTSSVKRSRDNVPSKASEKLAATIGSLSFSDGDSVGKFFSVVRLHGAAQEAASSQAQLVNLWTAMEVLVPRASDSKLRGVRSLLTPFLIHGYFDKLLYALAGDLYRWNSKGVSKILKRAGLSDWSQHQKVAAVLLGGPLEGLRTELYALVAKYPLLRNRCFEVSSLIGKREKLKVQVAEHEQRLSWQLERIYRARNAIVHDGAAPAQVDALAENAHEYLDMFIDRFLLLCARLKYVTTLEEAIAFQAKLTTHWRGLLSSDEPVTSENVREVCALYAKPKDRQ